MKQVEKKVIIDLNPVTISVMVNPDMKDDMILEEAKKFLPKVITEKFPGCSYSINDASILDFKDCIPGKVVCAGKTGTGIILKRNKININVAFSGGRILTGKPAAFSSIEVKDIDDILWKRVELFREENSWNEGDVGYFINKGTITPVIITKANNGVYDLTIISSNPEGSYYKNVSEMKVKTALFDDKKLAEAYFLKVKNS